MKAVYHLKKLDDGRLGISFTLTTPDGDKSFITCSKKKVGTLTDLDRVCKANIKTCLWANGYGGGHDIWWDEDPTDIQDMNIVGLGTYKKRIVVNQTDTKDVVYEVVKIDNVWTVVKHDAPLMTWDEAVTELKKRI